MSEVTQILNAVERGEYSSERLLPLIYDELRQLAARKMANEAPGHTLQPTALVHEAWQRLTGHPFAESQRWDNRGHFFAAAAEAMRRILIDRARAKVRLRRGGGRERVPLENVTLAVDDPDETVLAIHEVLDRLTARDEVKAQIVKLRYFAGLSHDEIARALGMAEPTVRRHWAFARSWLYAELKREFAKC